MALVFDLLRQMCVFLVLAYLFTKTPAFRTLTSETLRPRHRLILYIIFSAFSISGTYFGLPIQDAIANTRAIGAVIAGLLGGPLLGFAVGLTSGLHRVSLGGFTALACGVSTTTEGLLGGIVRSAFSGRHDEPGFDPRIAFGATFLAELAQMAIILAMARPFSAAWALVEVIAVPMILANAVGAALFVSILRDQRKMAEELGAAGSSRALRIAERSLEVQASGLSEESARELCEEIHAQTGVSAVAITNRRVLLAYVGEGADHHRPGDPLRSAPCERAVRDKRVVFADGVRQPYRCEVSPGCSHGSLLVVPVLLDDEVIGTIKLFERKNKLFLNINRTLGEGIARLISEALLRARYEDQKNLLLRSELKLIQAQVNPHFLFNTLNTVSAISRDDPKRARELLHHLSNFFRKNLKRASDISTLGEELDHVRSYLMIEKARFEDRLQVDEEVDEALGELPIPAFTLQPIVENAVKHGTSTLLGQGLITISARVDGDQAVLSVSDNAGALCEGESAAPGEERVRGLGMRIVDKRLESLYGDACSLSSHCDPGELTRIELRLPLPDADPQREGASR